jgi:predicted esterase
LWFTDVPKGTGYIDDLGNDIVAVQDGPGSVDSITKLILGLIDTEKNALPAGKQSYQNIRVVGFSEGAATTVALLSKWDKAEPIKSMVAYAGWMPTDHAKWANNIAVQQTIPFLQLAGSNDKNFCPLAY